MSSIASTVRDHDEQPNVVGEKIDVVGSNNAIDGSEEIVEDEPSSSTGGINAADEATGLKLALIVFGLCFSNILTGLVSGTRISSTQTKMSSG